MNDPHRLDRRPGGVEGGRGDTTAADRTGPAWGIRRRIVVVFLTLLALALVVSLVVTRQALRARLDGQIDEALAQEVQELRALVDDGIDPETGQPFGDDVEAMLSKFLTRNVPADHEAFYTLVDGRPFLASFQAPPELVAEPELVDRWAGAVEPAMGSASTAVGEIRYLATPLVVDGRVDATFVVVYFPADDIGEIDDIFALAIGIGVVVFAVAAGLAWTAAGRLVRPVRALTDMARNITESDLSARIPTRGNDELTELGHTFNAMLARLETGFADQRQFLDDVAHELRTPITIVQGHLELLGDDPTERAETLELVQDELNRMRRYVDDLLLLAQAETTEFLRPEPLDVGELAASLHQKVQALGPRDWRLDAAPIPGSLAVVADPARLSQAVLNLAANAVDHTEPGTPIALGFEAAPVTSGPPGLRLWVCDRGPGLEPGLAQRVFDRRRRGANSRVRRSGGLGIGLAIVDAIVRAHGGTVRASNRPDGGACFQVELPGDATEPTQEMPTWPGS